MKELYVGAAYYPEMWEESEVDKDIVRCKEYGINTLRVGEFAWGKMEPTEGKFDFAWLLKVVDKLHAAGIYTVMCTPTVTPPRWLLDKYEETRMVGVDQKRQDVSSRCHPCKTSPKMREKNRIIVTEMAKVFGNHPGIIGWQLDNEIYPYYEGCRCPLCKAAFREYLKKKFGTVEKLNKAWGMVRWSLEYDSFDAVEPPYPEQWKHPSLVKAWWDFQCTQIVSYLNEQTEILRKYTRAPIGTDMMMRNDLGYYDVNENLDIVQFNHYETADKLTETPFYYDFLRCVLDKPFWVTETQVGWSGSNYGENGYRRPGNCYANTWLPIAKGGEMIEYWHFRAHPNGHELSHGSLFSTAGRAYRVSEEVKRASEEIRACRELLLGSGVKSKIAMHYSATATNSFAAAPLVKHFDYRDKLISAFYSAFRHYNIDVIDTPHSLDGYEVLVSPFLSTADENGLRDRVTEWVKKGGTWIVGPMSDIMDTEVSKYTDAPYSFLEELAGVYTVYQKPIDNDVFKAEWNDGTECGVGLCFDAYKPLGGTESLAKYTVGEFSGHSVITRRKVGKGSVILLGSVPTHADILRLTALPPILDASDGVVLVERSGERSAIIAVETFGEQGSITLPTQYTDMITGKKLRGKVTVAPHEVLVLTK